MKKYMLPIGICIFIILLYFGLGILFSLFISEAVTLTIMTDVSMIILGAIYYKKRVYRKKTDVKSDKGTWLNIVAPTLVLWIITQIMVTWYYNTFGDRLLDNYNANVIENASAYIILTLFLAPMAEEILMRGIVYPTLKNICRPWIAAAISSFVFAVLHGTAVHLLIGMYCGFYFIYIYEYTGKLRYSIWGHMFYNILSVFFSNLAVPDWCFTAGFVTIANIALIMVFIKFMPYSKQKEKDDVEITDSV